MQPDIIVIGAGVIGTACAHFLSAREFGENPAQLNLVTTRPPAKPVPLNLLMFDLES